VSIDYDSSKNQTIDDGAKLSLQIDPKHFQKVALELKKWNLLLTDQLTA